MTVALLCAAASHGQSISIGALGGLRTTDDMTGAGAVSASKRYVVGPAFDLCLPFGFALELDALYRRSGYQTGFANFAYSIFSDERANSWEFPILAKYRLRLGPARPFVEIGYAPRIMDGEISSNELTAFGAQGPLTQPFFSHTVQTTDWPVSHGLIAGGGLQFVVGRLQLAPTLRYTHWKNGAVSGYYGDGPSWASAQHQFDLLLGIAWKIR